MLRIYLLGLSLLCAACQPVPQDVHETRFIMGTLVTFTVVTSDTTLAKLAIRESAHEMQRIEDSFTIYGNKPNSIKIFNQLSINTPFSFSAEVNELLEVAINIEQQSAGAFSITLGSVNKLWGFSNPEAPQHPPSQKIIQDHLENISNCLQKQGSQWLRTSKNCQLDFGAIAKGYAIDKGIEILKKYGLKNAMINAGGDIRMIGKHGEHPWRIGIRDPRHQDNVIATLSLQGDVSIVTSGDYERYFIYDGKRYHHILDPKTAHPSYRSQSSTVIASSAMLADAWSTALFVMGEKGLKIITSMPMQALLIDSTGELQQTKNMHLDLPLQP